MAAFDRRGVALIAFHAVSHRYGSKQALSEVSFTVPDGAITGLVGPNGAGKTTALKTLMGLISPSSGTATVDGRPFAHAVSPLSEVGALISSEWIPGDRTALTTICSLAATHGIPTSRCRDLLALVGLVDVAHHKVRTFSLGMRQRLGVAIALLGEPKHLVLDEPVNGLDPQGVAWMRSFLKSYADRGGCVLLSSHLMSELENTADRVVVLSQGRVVAEDAISGLVAAESGSTYVEAEDVQRLVELLRVRGYVARPSASGALIEGASPRQISRIAMQEGLLLDRLEPGRSTLEEVFLGLAGRDDAELRGAV